MNSKAERSRNMRWRKPMLSELSLFEIKEKLYDIIENCDNVHWAFDDDELLNALDGDEEEMWEFKMTFTALESESEMLLDCIEEKFRWEEDAERAFDDMSVALIGNRFNVIGYDDYQEDYFSLTGYQQELAYTESGKRVMRKTKAELLSSIGQVLGIIIAFQNVQLKYEYLKATIDIFKDENNSILQTVKEIEEYYEKANIRDFHEYEEETRQFERLIEQLPDRIWIE